MDFSDRFDNDFEDTDQDNILLDGGDGLTNAFKNHMGVTVAHSDTGSVTLAPKKMTVPGFPLRRIEADPDGLPYLHDWDSPGWQTKVNAEKYRDLILSKIIYEGLRELSADSSPAERSNRIISTILEAHKMGGRLTSKVQRPLFLKIRRHALADALDASAKGYGGEKIIAPKQLPLELILYILDLGTDDPTVDTTTLPQVYPTTHTLNTVK